MNLLRQLEDTTKSKIKVDFLVLAPVALYDLWILEYVLSPIFDGVFFTNWFPKLSPIFMKFCLTWCKRKQPRTAALSLVKPKATENGYFFKFIHVYSSIIYTCTKLMVRHNSFKHVHIMLFTKVHHANSNSDQISMG